MNIDAIYLLNVDIYIKETIITFVSLLKQRFFKKIIEIILIVTFETKLTKLRQKPEKTFTFYHNRIFDIIYKYEIKNRIFVIEILFFVKSSLFDILLRD